MNQKHLISAQNFAEKARALGSEEAFVSEFPQAVLVVQPAELSETTGFETINRKAARQVQDEVRVAPLVKREGSNAFASMITVGRTENNDIVLKVSGVSKFHAFLKAEGGGFSLTDGGSTFGTWVNSTRLEPRVPAPLRCGDELRLGENAQLIYYTSSGFYQALRSSALAL